MRLKRNLIPSVFLVLALSLSACVFYPPLLARASQLPLGQYQPGEFLVRFKSNPKVYRFKTTPDLDIEAAIAKYGRWDSVEFIEPNYLYQAAAFPNDPDYSLQWYLTAVNAKEAWSKELLLRQTNPNLKDPIIAVLDTGVYLNHPDLKDQIWTNPKEIANDGIDNDRNGYIDDVYGWDFLDDDSDPNPSFSANYDADAVNHGTIVAGIAAAANNNFQGIAGVSWSGKIMPLRVLDSHGGGEVYSVIRAVDYAIANGADVINMSFVGDDFSQALFDAVLKAYNHNVIVVAAAGNTNPGVNGVDLDVAKSYPVCFQGPQGENMIIGVASIGKNLVKSPFSNYGSCIDLVAPGESFYATQVKQSGISGFENYYNGYWSGTSLSTPIVSAVLATVKSLNPLATIDQIQSVVLKATKDVYSYNSIYRDKLGYGLVDFYKAINTSLAKTNPVSQTNQNHYILAGLGYGSFPQLKLLASDDGREFKSFFAYSPYFNGAVRVASGDLNGDGQPEVITGTGIGGGPHVRIFDINGKLISQFFAYAKDFRGGVNIATADLDNDGKAEIITGPGPGIEPEVKVFDLNGNQKLGFLAYGQNFLGGVKVAAGDVDGDGRDNIVVGAGNGGGPHVRIFEYNGKLLSQFFAYNSDFHGGVNVAVGDFHGDGKAEIVVSIEKDSLPTVRVFNYQGIKLSDFFAFEFDFLKGVEVAVGDVTGDGLAEIIAGKAQGGAPLIKIFNINGKLKSEFFAHSKGYTGGVRTAVISF
ncbi:MAG: S8 family serine peptidase [Patescibacteria group bacterium]|jgi:hypothetical protein|nr:S8 family serine peptidase [Patescibacteria group bacterium]